MQDSSNGAARTRNVERAVVRDKKIVISRKLTDSNGELVFVKLLFDPDFKKPDTVIGIDVAQHIIVAHIFVRDAVAVRVKHAGVKGRTIPTNHFPKVQLERYFEQPLVFRPSAQTA